MSEYDESLQDIGLIDSSELFQGLLNIPININSTLCGGILDMKPNYAKTALVTSNEMIFDDEKLIHGGFIFGAAELAAHVSVNTQYSVTIGAKVNLYAPARVGDLIEFEAHAYFEESKKREVKVIGTIKGIKVFEGTYQIVVLEEHIFKLQQKKKVSDEDEQ
ncbi:MULTISPECIES: PaaI family thioesterase [Campylobacter]|uniref:Acyl-CoA thioesterase n=1 Tax=Campylobacter vicugnae TaxID=1660076 RepID=A0A1X9T1A2_9BACT|nr:MULTISPECIES: thioesterase [Campylobacter]MCR8689846.1 PaaI family thioesterase [Campylobacter sp. RM9264]MCR8700556.1 PaaI family thioesterase [Campylobacter sp. RM12176]ARR02243.1 acyl-CoA thioesterase [Campylobacter sp. RM8964]ARR03874.1 acyl-CoA thioesterase [Campylobacter sp. RM12175]MBO5064124.1 PaaI family thioesterase [Campylobacter sp.]